MNTFICGDVTFPFSIQWVKDRYQLITFGTSRLTFLLMNSLLARHKLPAKETVLEAKKSFFKS